MLVVNFGGLRSMQLSNQQIINSFNTFNKINEKTFSFLGNAKAPSILSSMIQEAHEIRENQTFKTLNSLANAQGAKNNIAEESVSNAEHFISYIWNSSVVCNSRL